MIEVNLVPDVKQELIRAQRVRSTVVSIATLVALGALGVVIALGITIGIQMGILASQDRSITDKGEALAKVEDLTEMLTIQNQLASVGDINSQKQITSRIFETLSTITPAGEDIKISKVTVGAEGDGSEPSMSIEGHAAGGYPMVELFKKRVQCSIVRYTVAANDGDGVGSEAGSGQQALTGCNEASRAQLSGTYAPLASNLSVSDTSYGQTADGATVVRFRLSFVFAPELFAMTSQNVRVQVVASGNVTDSYTGVPRSIFEQRASDVESGEGQ